MSTTSTQAQQNRTASGKLAPPPSQRGRGSGGGFKEGLGWRGQGRGPTTAIASGVPRTGALAIAGIVLAIALAARLPSLLATPGWDGDEGYTLEIAWNLAHGDARMFALEYRFVAHPPLAFAAIAPALRAFGRDLAVLRAGAGIASAFTVALVAWGLARAGLRRAAALGGVALAVAPFAVAYGRMGYTYGLLALVVAGTVTALLAWRRDAEAVRDARGPGRPTPSPTRRQSGVVAWPITLAALGPLIDHPGIALPVLVAIEVRLATRSWLNAAGALALSLAPAIAFHGAVAWLDPAGSGEEWRQLGARLGASLDLHQAPEGVPVPTLATTVALVLANVSGLMRASWWMPLAVAGLFAIPASAGRMTVLRAFALVAIPAFAVRPIDPFFRTAIPLLPLAGWGLGAILDRGVGAAFDVMGATPGRGPIIPRLLGSCVAALVLLPLGIEAGTTAVALLPSMAAPSQGSRADGGRVGRTIPLAPALTLPIDPWLIRDGDDARAAAAWVNAHVLPTDLVVASPVVTWLVAARVADHLQATARALPGTAVAFYPPVIAAARWRFDPSVQAARWVILDHVTDAWVAADPSTRQVLGPVADRAPAFRVGSYRVVPGGS